MIFKLYFLLLFCCSYFAFIAADSEICTTAPCKTLADTLQHRSMNTSVQPCDDFYEYICGNYPKFNRMSPIYEYSDAILTRQLRVNEEIDEALLKVNALNSTTSSKAVRYVARLYSECKDTAAWERKGTAPLLKLIEETVGGWPMVQAKNGKSGQNQTKAKKWPDIFVDVFSRTGLHYIFNIFDTMGALMIVPGAVVLDPAANSFDPERLSNETAITKYQEFLFKLISAFGVNINSTDQQAHRKLQEEIDRLIHFERNLEKAYHQAAQEYFHGTLGQFEHGTTHGKVPWSWMLRQVQVNFVQQQKGGFRMNKPPYNENTPLDSIKVPYFTEAIALLETTPIEVVQNFFATAVALNFGAMTTKNLRKIVYNFTGKEEEELLPIRGVRTCTQLAEDWWPMVLSRVYLDSHFSGVTRNEKMAAAAKLIAEIEASFRENLAKRNQWLDAITRKHAIEKLDAITAQIGYQPWILDNAKVDAFYPDLKEIDNLQKESFFETIVRLVARVRGTEDLAMVREPTEGDKNKTHFNMSPAAVNAYYSILENKILIPAGILHTPFFDHELPWSTNYGAIGALIGHELTHGFDSRGRKYDRHGKEDNWWSAATSKAYDERARCLEKQYSDIVDPRLGKHLDGEGTLEENCADNGGVKEAFGAYQAHQKQVPNDSKVLPGLKFTPDQLFFASYANMWCQAITKKMLLLNRFANAHAPNKYRVNVVLGNFDQFAKAFNCPIGSKMNPVHKCSIW